jgi:aspergillopepsin I
VFSSELSTSAQRGHSIYNPAKSSTAKKLSGATWSISYGDGSNASGDVYTDTVDVGGVSVTGQAVELAKTISAQFQQDQNNDGLLGLAFSSINTGQSRFASPKIDADMTLVKPKQQTTFFQTAINEGVLAQNVFTVDLKKGEPGSYDFGFIDDSKYTGEITYTPIDNSQGFWEFTGTGYQVGDGQFQDVSIDAIADTGTTLLLLDDDIVAAYYQQVQGAKNDQTQGGYTFPCSADLPDFTLGIADSQATIPGSFMNFAPISDGSSSELSPAFLVPRPTATNTCSACYGGIQSNSGIGLSIYGDIFLKAVFAVFDSDNLQFGVAAKDL